MDILGMKRAAAKIVLKLLNFGQKYLRMHFAQEILTTFNNYPDLLKAITLQKPSHTVNPNLDWWRIMDVWLWHWNQSPIIPVEAFRRAKTDKSASSSVNCEGFATSFLRLQWRGASGIFDIIFAAIEEIKEESKQKLMAIPKSEFQKCFKVWKKH